MARLIRELPLPGLLPDEAARLDRAGRRTFTRVAEPVAGPVGAGRQLAVAGALFDTVGEADDAGPERIARVVRLGGREIAVLLERAYGRCAVVPTAMFARPGDDAYAWNLAAKAWNAARVRYLEVLEALDAQEVLDLVCPGQVPVLDVVEPRSWRAWVGERGYREIEVWAGLPLPWRVAAGAQACPAELVERVCRRHGVDPVRAGWTARPARRGAAGSRLTELFVDGVAEGDPVLARVLGERT